MKSLPFLRLPVLLAVLSGMVAGCHKSDQPAAVESVEPKVASGKIMFPERSPQLASLLLAPAAPCADSRLRLNGRLAWNDDVTVRVFSPFAGRITQVAVSPGAKVEKDGTLALLASPDFGQAQADHRKAVTDLSLAERNMDRLKELAEHGAAAAKDVAFAAAELAHAQSEARRTTARLALYGATEDAVDNAYVLKSPVSGVVVERNLSPGQEVRPDQMLAGVERLAAPLFVVTDPTKLWLMLDVSEADAARIEVGQALEIRVPTHPDRVFRAVLDYESDSLDPMTRTIRARAVVDNADRQLKAEQLVNVEVARANTTAVLDVPAAAVFLKGDRHFVFSETSPASFVRLEVRVGRAQHGRVQVTAGLKAGDRVVTEGVMLLEQLWENAPADSVQTTKEESIRPASAAL